MFGFFPLYDKYRLHFIYDNEEEDLLKIATNRLQKNQFKKSYLLTCNVRKNKTQFPFENHK